ncbi:MAG: 4-amino-4-deoxychorismate lyase [Leptolyngbya sp. LCM1.Bin17]|nr:MAG: 4-amino-4-deoxychorismate lyase [Leptolyngbya sp. LCM1.Bin17]
MSYWFNGHLHNSDRIDLGIHDPALLYGATVFTTLRVYAQTIDHPLTQWSAHQHRLKQTLTDFHWPAPDWTQVRRGAEHLKRSYPVLRIACLPDGRELITGRPLPAHLATLQTSGITAWVAQTGPYQRGLPRYKTGNYLGSWLALQAAQAQAAKEAILVNNVGDWLETSTGNLWGWARGQWWTPPWQAGLLPGIARQQVLDYLHRLGIPVQTQPWTRSLIPTLEVLAYTNGVVQVVPIHTVLKDQSRLEFDPEHSCLRELRAAFQWPNL